MYRFKVKDAARAEALRQWMSDEEEARLLEYELASKRRIMLFNFGVALSFFVVLFLWYTDAPTLDVGVVVVLIMWLTNTSERLDLRIQVKRLKFEKEQLQQKYWARRAGEVNGCVGNPRQGERR